MQRIPGRPTREFAALCGQLRIDWHFCEPADPQAKGVVARLQDFIEKSFELGRCFANELDYGARAGPTSRIFSMQRRDRVGQASPRTAAPVEFALRRARAPAHAGGA